jgi:hypothetical protein
MHPPFPPTILRRRGIAINSVRFPRRRVRNAPQMSDPGATVVLSR